MKCSKQTLVRTAIVNFFSSSQRIALIHYFPLEVNGGGFLSLLVAFRNTATRRHSEIKRIRSTTKQEFSGEAFSKLNIKASLASLPFDSSRAPTEWSAIFAFGVLAYKISHCLSANHNPDLGCAICTGVALFAPVLHFLHRCYTFCSGGVTLELHYSPPIRIE